MARAFAPTSEFPRVAVLVKRGKLIQAEDAFGRGESVYVGRKSLGGAGSGDLVVLKPAGRGRGEVVRRLGKAKELPVIMEGILTYYDVPRGFSKKALAEAEAAAGRAGAADPERHDLTGLVSFTVDPDEARDYDDAISLVDGPGPGEVTLYVHIADVSYFMADGSALDSAAARKACSVYLPLTVEPMLPPVLSSDICSLRPDVERKTVTVEMVFAWPKGEAGEDGRSGPLTPVSGRTRFYRSLIRSRRRLTYNEVDDHFEGAAAIGGEPGQIIDRCRALAADLRDARHARGALNISTFEPEFRLDEDGEVTGVRPRPESESHALIEEFMIAANEAVAGFLEHRRSDCVYRVHEEPDAAAVDALFDLLEELGVATPPFSLKEATPAKTAQAVRDLLASLPSVLSQKQQSRSAFGEIVLRSLKQARYYEENLGHFGLASPAYLHFTSPIRRYPDLVVHRALLKELHLESVACDRLRLAEIAQESSDAERRAASVERTGDDVVLAHLLDRLLFEEGWDRVFEGEIVSVIPSGVFVRFEQCYEGYVHARKLRGDYFAINERGSALVGRRSGRPWRLSDRLDVRVTRIDKLKGKVELEPA